MDRGGRTTILGGLAVAAATIAAVRIGLPAETDAVVGVLPELVAVPVTLLAVRLGLHRALVVCVLLVLVHRLDQPAIALTAVTGLHLGLAAVLPDGRLSRPGPILHLAVAAGSLLGVAMAVGRIRSDPRLAWLEDPRTAWITLAGAVLVALAMLIWRRQPLESALTWVAVALAVARLTDLVPQPGSLVVAAAQVTVLIALVEQGHRLAYHDRLTGLPNRRAFDERLPRLRGAYAVAMVDVDRFKAFNDRWGHPAGDQALRMVAAELARIGGGGTAYRYGGEEFAIVFPSRASGSTLESLEGVRRSIAERGFVVRAPGRRSRRRSRGRGSRPSGDRKQVKLTVSIGVSSPDTRRTDPAAVLRAADRALYRAKRLGRNRVAST